MNDLPTEIVEEIVQFLPVPDVFSLSRTCRRMYALVDCGNLFRSMEWSIEGIFQETLTGKRNGTSERLVFIFCDGRDKGRFLYYVGKRLKREADVEGARIRTLGLDDSEVLHFAVDDGTHVVHRENWVLRTDYRYNVAKKTASFSTRDETSTYRADGVEPTVERSWVMWVDFSNLSGVDVPSETEGVGWGTAVRFRTFTYSFVNVRGLVPYKQTERNDDKETTTYADGTKTKTTYFIRYSDGQVDRECALVIVCRDGALCKMTMETYRRHPDEFLVKEGFETLYSRGSEIKELSFVDLHDGEVLVIRQTNDAAIVKVLCNDHLEQLAFPIRTTDAVSTPTCPLTKFQV